MIPVINKEKTASRLRNLMHQRGITVKDIQQYLNLGSVQSVYHWLNGHSMPTIDNLYALSELFELSIDEMICGSKTKQENRLLICRKVQSMPQVERILLYYNKLQKSVSLHKK